MSHRASAQRAGASTFAARVVATFGRQSLIEDGQRQVFNAVRKGKRGDVVVGDRVTASMTGPDQATIVAIDPRATLLYRSEGPRTKELAANIDQVLVVYAGRPTFNRWFIWKALLAARAAGIDARVVLNKTDLGDAGDAQQFRARLAQLGWPTHAVSATAEMNRTQAELMSVLHRRHTLLVGQSGMGKSTLLNLLVPQAQMRTQEFSQHLNLGKQTTTSSRWFWLPGTPEAGALIDTPGFQEFGLTHLDFDDIVAGFPEFAPHLGQCRFADCRHRAEPECAVTGALRAGAIDAERHRFYLSLIERF